MFCEDGLDLVATAADCLALAAVGLSEMDTSQWQRVQRTRSRRATVWMQKPSTPPNLLIASLVLGPLEKVMLGSQFMSICQRQS